MQGKKTQQLLTSLADSAPSLSSFPFATASHSWESVQVSGPSGPSTHKQTGVEVAEGRPGGSKLYVRTSGTPISVCECRTDELLFLLKLSFHDNTTPLPQHPLPHPPPATGGCRGGCSGGHLLILKIWTGSSLLSKSVVIHLMDPPTPPETATPPLSSCSTSAQVDGPPRASPRNAPI